MNDLRNYDPLDIGDIRARLTDEYREAYLLIEKILRAAENCRVGSEGQASDATVLTKQINEAVKRAKEGRKVEGMPYKDVMTMIGAFFEEITLGLDTAKSETLEKIDKWRKKKEKEDAKLAEARLIEAESVIARARTTEDRERGEVLAREASELAKGKRIDSEYGTLAHGRQTWKFEVVDMKAVPRGFLLIDRASVNKAIHAGLRNIPGLHIYQVETTVVR
jgi:hypothetical protein